MQVGILHTQIFHVVSRTKDIISGNCNKNNVIDKKLTLQVLVNWTSAIYCLCFRPKLFPRKIALL